VERGVCLPDPARWVSGLRGGSWDSTVGLNSSLELSSSSRGSDAPYIESEVDGFRLAMVPEPSTGLLVFAGLLGAAGWRRAHS
jgi:hypothetical protein